LSQLPDKQYSYIACDINSSSIDCSLHLSQMRQQIGSLKTKAATEFINNFFENNPGSKLVVFAHHHVVLDEIYASSTKAGIASRILDGRITNKQTYQDIIDTFQKPDSNEIACLIVGMTSAIGYNLNVSSNALFVEFLYTPSDLKQCEDRLHRIGTKQAVNIYYLYARQIPIEASMVAILQSKTKTINEIIENKLVAQNDPSLKMLEEILSANHSW